MRHRIITIGLALVLPLAVASAGTNLPGARAEETNRVGLVVMHGNGSTTTRCVEFGEPEISGWDVLERSGLNVVAAFGSGMGVAICKIEDEGCPKESCLTCDSPNYWSYWHLLDGAWVYSQVGASSYIVHNGDVEGWRWGAGDPPPAVTFDQTCAPSPTDTPLPPTDTPVPPTATLLPPTDTPAPPTATSAPAVPEVWFRLDKNPIPAGSCTYVRWDTSNTQEVYLDRERVDLNGSREICPTTSQEYELRVVGAEDEKRYQLTLGVIGSAPSSTPVPTSQPTVAPPSPSPIAESASAVFSTPTATPQAQSSATPSPSAMPSQFQATSPSPTPMQIVRLKPTSTPAQIAQLESEAQQQPPTSDNGKSPSPFLPLGYVAFSLIVGGLLGWLIFLFKFRT